MQTPIAVALSIEWCVGNAYFHYDQIEIEGTKPYLTGQHTYESP